MLLDGIHGDGVLHRDKTIQLFNRQIESLHSDLISESSGLETIAILHCFHSLLSFSSPHSSSLTTKLYPGPNCSTSTGVIFDNQGLDGRQDMLCLF